MSKRSFSENAVSNAYNANTDYAKLTNNSLNFDHKLIDFYMQNINQLP